MAITDLTNTTWVLNDTLSSYPGGTYNRKIYNINIITEQPIANNWGNKTNDTFVACEIGYNNGNEYNRFDVWETSSGSHDDEIYPLAEGNDTKSLPDTWNTYYDKSFTITGGTDATNSTLITWLEQNATAYTPPVPSVPDVVVSYNDNDIVTMTDSDIKTLATSGTYCTDDIKITFTKQSGGGSTPLIGTTATLTPTQVKTALRAGTDICLEYHGAFDQVPVDFRFTSWNGATDDVNGVALDAVVSNTIVYYNDNYYLFDLTGIIASGGTTLNSWFLHNTNLGGGSGGFRHIAEDTVCGAVKLGDISTLTATGDNSVAQGSFSAAIGDQSHAEGNESSAYGPGSHAEGILTHAYGSGSHAQGETTTVTNDGNAAHAEGKNTQASSTASHAEGNGTTASGAQSHAEGYYSLASTATAHAEGDNTTASGYASHAQGVGNIASSAQAFAGGYHSTASHSNSFVHGMNLKTSHSEQAVFGQFNADDSTAFLLVGRGSSDADADRRNAFAVHTDGRASAGANATASEDLVRLGQILDLQVNTVSGDVTCSNGSWCTPTSVQLNSTGLYLVSAHVQFASSSAGRRTIILTSSPSGSTGNLMNHQCIDARAPVNGDKTTCSIVTILNVTQANYKIYCRAWQNSGSTRTVTGSLRAVKLK